MIIYHRKKNIYLFFFSASIRFWFFGFFYKIVEKHYFYIRDQFFINTQTTTYTHTHCLCNEGNFFAQNIRNRGAKESNKISQIQKLICRFERIVRFFSCLSFIFCLINISHDLNNNGVASELKCTIVTYTKGFAFSQSMLRSVCI